MAIKHPDGSVTISLRKFPREVIKMVEEEARDRRISFEEAFCQLIEDGANGVDAEVIPFDKSKNTKL